MTPNTKKQISNIKLDPNLPVMIFDADEVLVHFAEPFAKYLKKHDYHLHLTGYRLDNAIKKAKTDNSLFPTNGNDLKSRPEIENLVGIYSSLSGKKIDSLFNEFKDKNFSFFKEQLSDIIIKKISPISKEIKRLNQDSSYIDQVLQDGSEKAYELSSKKIKDIKKKFGF